MASNDDSVPSEQATTASASAPQKGKRGSQTVKRITVNLRESDDARLRAIATEEDLTDNDAIRRALATEAFINEQLRKGKKLLLEEEDGTVSRVEFVR